MRAQTGQRAAQFPCNNTQVHIKVFSFFIMSDVELPFLFHKNNAKRATVCVYWNSSENWRATSIVCYVYMTMIVVTSAITYDTTTCVVPRRLNEMHVLPCTRTCDRKRNFLTHSHGKRMKGRKQTLREEKVSCAGCDSQAVSSHLPNCTLRIHSVCVVRCHIFRIFHRVC